MPVFADALKLLVKYANGNLFKRPIVFETVDGASYGIATDEESMAFVRIHDAVFERPVAVDFEEYKQLLKQRNIQDAVLEDGRIVVNLPRRQVVLSLKQLSGTISPPQLKSRAVISLDFESLLAAYRRLGIDTLIDEVVVGRYLILRAQHFQLATYLGNEKGAFSVRIRPFAHALKLFEGLDAKTVNIIRSHSLVLFTEDAAVLMDYTKDPYDDIDVGARYICAVPRTAFIPETVNEIEVMRNIVIVNNNVFPSEQTFLTTRKKLGKKLAGFIVKRMSDNVFVGVMQSKSLVLRDEHVVVLVH